MAVGMVSTHVLLAAWERAVDASPTGRAVSLLAAAHPDRLWDDLAWLTIGERDTALLGLRMALFGDDVAAVAACPACGERLDLAFPLSGLLAGNGAKPVPTLTLTIRGYAVTVRLPTSRDVLDLPPGAAAADLLARCLVEVRRGGRTVSADRLPAIVISGLSARMADADPAAQLDLALTCPDCGHAWSAPFDIAAFLWSEVDGWAGRVLRDVHALARAYGWSEAEILALSPRRRQTYLELAWS